MCSLHEVSDTLDQMRFKDSTDPADDPFMSAIRGIGHGQKTSNSRVAS
jgi:hypothetical protein